MDVPMVFSDNEMPSLTGLQRGAQVSDVLLAFNEPEYDSQANMALAVAARTLRYVESVWPGERYCGGNIISHAGWFDQMLTAYKAAYGRMPRLAGFHLHVYVAGGLPNIEHPDDGRWLVRGQANFKAYLDVMRQWGVPARVVVSECCLLGKYPEGVYLKVQEAYMGWLRSEPASSRWRGSRPGTAAFPRPTCCSRVGG